MNEKTYEIIQQAEQNAQKLFKASEKDAKARRKLLEGLSKTKK